MKSKRLRQLKPDLRTATKRKVKGRRIEEIGNKA